LTKKQNNCRNQAKASIKEYVTEALPEQYQICLTALDAIIKRAFDMLENSYDSREKLQAMQLFRDTHITKLELLSNATTIDSALNFIRSKQQQSSQLQEEQKQDSTNDYATTDTNTGSQTVF
jgi:hypothetical protein